VGKFSKVLLANNKQTIMELEEEEIKTCDYCNHEMLAEDGAFCSEDCAKGYFSDIT